MDAIFGSSRRKSTFLDGIDEESPGYVSLIPCESRNFSPWSVLSLKHVSTNTHPSFDLVYSLNIIIIDVCKSTLFMPVSHSAS